MFELSRKKTPAAARTSSCRAAPLDDGVSFNGKRYRSLLEGAREIASWYAKRMSSTDLFQREDLTFAVSGQSLQLHRIAKVLAKNS